MKSLVLAVSALALVATAHAAPGRRGGVSIIQDMPEAAFAPPGFDSNDHSQVVLAGTFMNSCFKAGSASADVDTLNRTITITQKAYVQDSSVCIQMLVPYSTVVDVGILPPGSYEVKVVADKKEKVLEQLPISPSSESVVGPDESLYAVADEVSFSKGTLKLKGKLPGSCTRLKEVKILTRKSNIVEVLPILETVSENGAVACADEFADFEKEIALELPFHGRTLFHVRSLNGQALNKVIEIR